MNDYVGFGLMDARKMVDAAINWTSVPSKVICTIPGPNSNRWVIIQLFFMFSLVSIFDQLNITVTSMK